MAVESICQIWPISSQNGWWENLPTVCCIAEVWLSLWPFSWILGHTLETLELEFCLPLGKKDRSWCTTPLWETDGPLSANSS